MTDLSPSDVNSRFKLLPKPTIHPGKCACCGAVNCPVVDFGFSLIGYGAIMLCVNCLSEAARKVGMVSESTLSDNQRAADQIVNEYLVKNSLRVISDGQYDNLLQSVAGLFEFASSTGGLVPEKDSDPGIEQLAFFDAGDVGGSASGELADSNVAGGKGSNDLRDFTLG